MTPNVEKDGVVAVMGEAIACLDLDDRETASAELVKAVDVVKDLIDERDRLRALINSPITLDFLTGTANEITHQVERWGTVHDRAKEPADWFWLVGYLAGKVLRAHVDGDTEKALHHTISTAAALGNWHAHIRLGTSEMQPGSSDLQQFLESAFGSDAVAQLSRAA